MKTELHSQFVRAYRKRITKDAKLTVKVAERLNLFREDFTNPILKDHALTGKKSHLRAFWITGDIRIVYQPISVDKVLLLDIGSHNQVY